MDTVNPDLPVTPENISELVDRIMVPEMATNKKLVLFGHEVAGRALPNKYAKRLRKASKDFFAKLADVISVQRDDKMSEDDRRKVIEKYPNLDEEAADVLTECVRLVCEFYKVPHTIEDIEEQFSIHQLLDILNFQLELNRDDDFLLQPLRISLSVVSGVAVLTTSLRRGVTST